MFHQNESPLAWLNQAMAPDGIEFRVLPIAVDPLGVVSWLAGSSWPAQ